jgi:hypothetical protein
MADSTKTAGIDLHDSGSYCWTWKTSYNSNTDEHKPHVVSIDMEHQNIHEGLGFTLSGKITGLGAGATAYMLFITDSAIPHFRAADVKTSGAPVDFTLYEDSTVSANGAALTPRNNNRLSATTATMLCYSGPTVTGVGTLLETSFIPSTSSGRTGGEASKIGAEWIFDTATNYLVGITNNDSQAINIGYSFFWYEA